MIYNININKKYIAKVVDPARLTYDQVKKSVAISHKLYREKPDWYIVNNFVQYFKTHKDARFVGELLSKDVISLVGGSFHLTPAEYKPVILTEHHTKKMTLERVGLLSPNIQSSELNYCDLTTLHNLFYDLPRQHNAFTIKGLLEVLSRHDIPNYDELKLQIIATYVIDWFTHQLDRNSCNLLFEYDDLSFDDAPRVRLARLIDNESSFAVSSNGVIDSEYQRLWIPAIPYSRLEFKDHPEKFDGLDYNISELMLDYPEEVGAVINILCATDFNPALEKYAPSYNAGISVGDDCISFFKSFIDEKKEEASKIKSLQF